MTRRPVTTVDLGINHTIIKLPEVMRVTGLSRSSIYRLARLGKFPAPLKLSERSIGWRSSDVKEWVDSRPVADLAEL